MNPIKIGEFISSQRKSNHLTQVALAEKLGITDRAVSKWERGKGLPDASLMLDLCEILGITVNELLYGEKISMENNNQKNEQLLLDMAKELEKKRQNNLDFYVGNYDCKYNGSACRHLDFRIFDSRRSMAACHDFGNYHYLFDTLLFCIKA